MIKTDGLHEFGEAIVERIGKGEAIVDGAAQEVDVYKTEVVGNEVRIYLLFDGNYEGRMTSFRLKSATTNKVLVEQPDDITKIYNKLLLITFKITLSERVVVG